jgi:multidrug efflux pump subunit AcrA (membrane-fusion protein)
MDGVALIPTPSGKSDTEEAKSNTLAVGQEVKALGSLLSIGDLSGYQIQFQVSELNVTQIQAGLPAFITGDAFPGITLKGYIKQVAYQANPAQGGGDSGVSMFNIIVNVPNVPEKDSAHIRIGMTAKVEVQLKNPPKIVIPINAVFTQNNQLMVTIVDPKTGQERNVPVQTGITTVDKVEIIKGVQAGDKVVVREGEK